MPNVAHATGIDSPEDIQVCLNCPLEKCVDCLAYGLTPAEVQAKLEKRKKKINSSVLKNTPPPDIDPEKLNAAERAVYYGYCKGQLDSTIAFHLKVSEAAVIATRERLGLPQFERVSRDSRRIAIERWLHQFE